jgi:hypothetical protein
MEPGLGQIVVARYQTREHPRTGWKPRDLIAAFPVGLDHNWSGDRAPESRGAEVRAAWTDHALHLHFDCRQGELLIVSANPILNEKTMGLWERDVCEAFIAPDRNEPQRYFEFEAAPTGEWLDLGIQQTEEGRLTDWEYRSGMTVASQVEADRILIGMRIPWEAFGSRPNVGDRWRANFFRCVGSGEGRGYLAWQPTLTTKPNFHVPNKFGELVFEK